MRWCHHQEVIIAYLPYPSISTSGIVIAMFRQSKLTASSVKTSRGVSAVLTPFLRRDLLDSRRQAKYRPVPIEGPRLRLTVSSPCWWRRNCWSILKVHYVMCSLSQRHDALHLDEYYLMNDNMRVPKSILQDYGSKEWSGRLCNALQDDLWHHQKSLTRIPI